jgi:hypothetical protein
MRMNWFRGMLGMVLVTTLLAGGGCSLLLNKETAQCQTSDDCVKFGNSPNCNTATHLCESSGLFPKECFRATAEKPPKDPTDFLNQCTKNVLPGGPDNEVGQCLSFTRDPDGGATLEDPPPPVAPPATMQTAPKALCKDLVPTGGSILYLSGSSNFQPLLRELAPAIVKKTGIRPVFRITTSCTGTRSMNTMNPAYATEHFVKDPVAVTEAYAQIFLGDGNLGVNCLLGTTGVAVDVGESEIYPETCGTLVNDPVQIAEGLGPILPMVFAVPQVSTERSISYQAARQVFGGGGGVSPWEKDDNFIFVRGAGTATLRLVAQELDLTFGQMWGVDQGTATNMINTLSYITDAAVAPSAIGIVGADFSDFARGNVKVLGFQAKQQNCATVPDSSLTTRDKINVRDGHYPLWGRIHFYTSRAPGASETAQTFAFLLTNPQLDIDILNAFIDASFVPPCAMKVRRESELGTLTSQDPAPYACGCAFDARVNPNKSAPPPGCVACPGGDGDCTDAARPSACHYGYCEPVQ